MSTPSVAPVATGTTGVFHNEAVVRFQQGVDLNIDVNELVRRVQRLARQLTPVPPIQARPLRRSHRSAWWPDA